MWQRHSSQGLFCNFQERFYTLRSTCTGYRRYIRLSQAREIIITEGNYSRSLLLHYSLSIFIYYSVFFICVSYYALNMICVLYILTAFTSTHARSSSSLHVSSIFIATPRLLSFYPCVDHPRPFLGLQVLLLPLLPRHITHKTRHYYA